MEKKNKTPAFSLKVDVFSPLFVLLKKKKNSPSVDNALMSFEQHLFWNRWCSVIWGLRFERRRMEKMIKHQEIRFSFYFDLTCPYSPIWECDKSDVSPIMLKIKTLLRSLTIFKNWLNKTFNCLVVMWKDRIKGCLGCHLLDSVML